MTQAAVSFAQVTKSYRNMAGMAGFGALGAVMSASGAVSEDKKAGWLRQLRLTPLPPGTAVVGRGISAMFLALPPSWPSA